MLPKPPHPIKQRLVGVALQIQRAKILEEPIIEVDQKRTILEPVGLTTDRAPRSRTEVGLIRFGGQCGYAIPIVAPGRYLAFAEGDDDERSPRLYLPRSVQAQDWPAWQSR